MEYSGFEILTVWDNGGPAVNPIPKYYTLCRDGGPQGTFLWTVEGWKHESEARPLKFTTRAEACAYIDSLPPTPRGIRWE